MQSNPYKWEFRPQSAPPGGRVATLSTLEVAVHPLYGGGSAVRLDDRTPRPLSSVASGSGGSRRYALSDTLHTAQSKTNLAQQSSQYMLKQLAGTKTPERRKEHGQENHELTQLDSASSAGVYNRRRAWQSSSLPGSRQPAPAEQPAAEGPAVEGERSPEEATPQPAAATPVRELRAGGHARRRLLDASAFYANHGPDVAAHAMARMHLSPASVSRQHALAARRSDPFGHSVAGRGHYDIGPLR